MKKFFFAGILLIGGSLLSLFAAEGLLAFMGFKDNLKMQIACVPHFHSRVDFEEYSYEFTTNSQGLRYPEIPFKKSPQERRLLLLGDSFAQGVGVSEGQSMASLLETRLSRSGPTRVINGGLAGTGPLDYARVLKYIGLKYDPDAVLIMLYANDVSDTPDEVASGRSLLSFGRYGMGIKPLVHRFFPRLYTLLQRVRLKAGAQTGGLSENIPKKWIDSTVDLAKSRGISEARINQWREALNPDWVETANRGRMDGWVLALGLLDPDYWANSLDIASERSQKKWDIMKGVLNDMVQECRSRQIWVGVILAPAPFQYDPSYGAVWSQAGMVINPEWVRRTTVLEKELMFWSDAQEVPYLDLTPSFRQAALEGFAGRLHYRLDHHWTAEGNVFAEALIAQWLSRQNLVSE
ncbi:MAG: hypothetical protein HY592_01325 [Candidatus Omnitrophica bacterium]|nr:hypothetical protein [Candidatus Omnitrophota bacterium]